MDVKTALLIFLYQGMIHIGVQAAEEDSTPSRSALFTIQENKRLEGHVVKQFESPSLMSCSHSCLRNAWCTSTNFKEPSEKNGKGTCDLNKHGAIDENTKPRDQQGVTLSVRQLANGFSVAQLMEHPTGNRNKSNVELSLQVRDTSQGITTPEMQVAAHYALLFPRKGITDYVIIKGGMPSLKAVTVCLWMKTNDTGNYGTPLSYAVQSGSTNELILFDYRNFGLNVRGRTPTSGSQVNANDGKWHHICLTWENTGGSWKLFKDGMAVASDKGLATGQVIGGGGVLVLGQDQDSVGGTFDDDESFIGETTGVNIWDHVITDQEIMRMSRSCMTGVGNVYQWRDFKAHLKGSVKIIKPSC